MWLKWPWGNKAAKELGEGDGGADGPVLLALTPEYEPGQHSTYVEWLTRGLADDTVHNIALTGRYGVGKSSVLSEFARQQAERVLSLSLSTLGPDERGESSTNQIEKELVKQLLHSKPPRDLPQSRYRRIESLSIGRAAAGSAVQLTVVGGLLWFFGLYPRIAVVSGGHGWLLRIGAALLFAGMAIAALTWIRLAVHNRVVASISAAGASISLADKGDSYFDEYLDEIVYYFERTPVDVVVFEDLDRFDEPRIFEALRELNSLLNAARAVHGKTIRFVYALKDSIFEQLGQDTAGTDDVDDAADVAVAESVRANRTKFFDLVVPMVPFITHRNSRDLLSQLLEQESLVPVSPGLIDLVARHLADMRQLKNIRNEYAVFAARLITGEQGVSKLRPDSLFAMMVYKNVHLADFERIQLGRSDLDLVYRQSRRLVAESLDARRAWLRQITAGEALTEAVETKAAAYADKLKWYVESIVTRAHSRRAEATYHVGDKIFAADKLGPDFWRAVLGSDHQIVVKFSDQYMQLQAVTISRADLWELLNEELRPDDWDGRERNEIAEQRVALAEEISMLRTAGFKELAEHSDFTVRSGDKNLTFDDVLQTELKSEVARDLVRHGYIDQNFALYVAQYYADHVSAAAMTFILQHVQTNTPDPDYDFPDPQDIESVLRETRGDFLDQHCAYNTQILDHLLADPDPGRARQVLDRLIRVEGPLERSFLAKYLADGKRATEAVARLTPNWAQVFGFVVELADLDNHRRIRLVNTALKHASTRKNYRLTESVDGYLQTHYPRFRCLTRPVEELAVRNAVKFLARAGVVIRKLSALDPQAQQLVVEEGNYVLSATNLRTALGDPETLSLDKVREIDERVFEHCITQPAEYLAAVSADRPTTVTVEDATTFVEIVALMVGWSEEHLTEACRLAEVDCFVDDLADVPESVWSGIVAARRCPATITNVARYIEFAQGIDAYLADLLTEIGAILRPNDSDEGQKLHLAKAILNSSATIPSPGIRAGLVVSLEIDEGISPAAIVPENGELLGLLLEKGICTDTPDLFERFRTTDWDTLSYGIECSMNFADFVSPRLLDEDAAEHILSSTKISPEVKNAVLARLDEFIPSDHRPALQTAAQFAAATGHRLDAGQLERIARVTNDATSVVALLEQLGDGIAIDTAVDILAALGTPYSDLKTPGAKITLPKNEQHLAILSRLRDAGQLTFTVRRAKPELAIVVG